MLAIVPVVATGARPGMQRGLLRTMEPLNCEQFPDIGCPFAIAILTHDDAFGSCTWTLNQEPGKRCDATKLPAKEARRRAIQFSRRGCLHSFLACCSLQVGKALHRFSLRTSPQFRLLPRLREPRPRWLFSATGRRIA